MLRGEEGNQAKELEELIEWLREHQPDAVWLSTALLAGLARRHQGASSACRCSARCRARTRFLDGLPEPWRARCWETLARAHARRRIACIAPSRYLRGADGSADAARRRSKLRVHFRTASTSRRLSPNADAAAARADDRLSRAVHSRAKGLGLVVEAFILLKKRGRFPDAETALRRLDDGGGRGVRGEAEGDGSRPLGCADDVEFLPNVSREEKIAFLQSSHAALGAGDLRRGVRALSHRSAGRGRAGRAAAIPRRFPEIVEATGGGMLVRAGKRRGARGRRGSRCSRIPDEARALGRHGTRGGAARLLHAAAGGAFPRGDTRNRWTRREVLPH